MTMLSQAQRSAPMIDMQGAVKQFGSTTVIDHISLQVPSGSIYCFIGPSGSGKTTVIRMLNGVYAPNDGSVEVMGKPPTRWTTADREQVGYMPQLFVLYPNLSVEENVDFAASSYGMGWWARRKPKRELLEFVGLWEHRRKLARSISGGMQRRLELACALIHDPVLIFLDEPTAGIDPILRATVWEHLRHLRDQGKTLFVTTQYVTEAEYCDRVGLINKGRLIADGTPDQVRKMAYGGEVVRVTSDRLTGEVLRHIEELPQVVNGRSQRITRTTAELTVDEASTAMPLILGVMNNLGIPLEQVTIEEIKPPYDDVFVRLIQDEEKLARTMERLA